MAPFATPATPEQDLGGMGALLATRLFLVQRGGSGSGGVVGGLSRWVAGARFAAMFLQSYVRALALMAALHASVHAAGAADAPETFSVLDYGARSGGIELCTEAFQQAIDAVSKDGGGTVFVPPGVYLVGPLSLVSNLVLWLSKGATLLADVQRERLPILPALPSWGPADLAANDPRVQRRLRIQADLRDAIPRYKPLLHGKGVHNVTITGENATLDGQGVAWWERWLSEPLLGRPHLIQFEESSDIRVVNVTLRNPGFWSMHLWQSEYLVVRFVTILVDPWNPPVRPTNTDGINPDSSRHVLIEDCYLQTGDDSVAVKSGWDCFGRSEGRPSENITIRRVVVKQTFGCNAAGFTIGSEMSGGVRDVLIEDSLVISAGVAVEIKVGTSRGGFVQRIRIRNTTVLETRRGGLVVMAVYGEPNPFCGDPPPAPVVRDISFDNVWVRGPTMGPMVNLQGTAEVLLENITMRRIKGIGLWRCSRAIVEQTDNSRNQCMGFEAPSVAGRRWTPHVAEVPRPSYRREERAPQERARGVRVAQRAESDSGAMSSSWGRSTPGVLSAATLLFVLGYCARRHFWRVSAAHSKRDG